MKKKDKQMMNKAIIITIVGILLIAYLYCILSKEEFKEFLQTIFGLAILVLICLIGWANGNSSVDRSQNTIEWEEEQERKARQEEEEDLLRQMHEK